VPAGVPAAAVPETRDMPDEDLVRAQGMTVGAPRGRLGDPLPVGRPHQIAQHGNSLVTRAPGFELRSHLRPQRSRHPGVDLVRMRLCVVQSRLRWTTKSPPRWGSREGANWAAVGSRIAAASAVALTSARHQGIGWRAAQ
jgi:hypothetical protein